MEVNSNKLVQLFREFATIEDPITEFTINSFKIGRILYVAGNLPQELHDCKCRTWLVLRNEVMYKYQILFKNFICSYIATLAENDYIPWCKEDETCSFFPGHLMTYIQGLKLLLGPATLNDSYKNTIEDCIKKLEEYFMSRL